MVLDSIVVNVTRLRTHWGHVTCYNKLQCDLLCSVSFQDGGYISRLLHSLVHPPSPVVWRNIKEDNPHDNPRN